MGKRIKSLAFITLLILSLVLLLSGCGKSEAEQEPAVEEEDTALYCPLDNEEIAELPNYLFAVSIDNGPKAQPQSGLNTADVLFEVPVEGGITRFLAVFYHNQADVIGPVRSARHYYIDLVQSLKGIYVHCGGSYIAKEALAAGAVPDIDEMANASTFWRDNTRSKPTNLYTSWENLQTLAAEKGLSSAEGLEGFNFYSSEEVSSLAQGTNTVIDIPYTYRAVSYQWDTDSQRYLRYSDGEPHMDAASDTQLYADNVVVIHNNSTLIDANSGLLDMTFVNSSGSGYVFQKGNVVPITWSMAQEGSPLVLTLSDGSEAKLLPGKTIFQVIVNDMAVTYDGGEDSTDTESAESAE